MSQLLRGLKPLDHEKHARILTAAEFGFEWPTPTYPIDKSGGITDLGMGGNGPDPTLTVNKGRPMGDCGPNAAPKNVNQTTAALGSVPYTAMTSNEVATLYATYEAEQAGITWRPTGDDWELPEGLDEGVEANDWVMWLFKNSYIKAFVKVPIHELEAALFTASAVIVAVSLNPDADEQCENGETWDISPGDEPDPEMGHFITLGYAGSVTGPFKWGTWGQWQESTLRWREKCPKQAFAIITEEDAAAANFPMAQVVAYLKALGGEVPA